MAASPCSKILHGEVIVVAALAIDPIIGRDHVVGIERGDDVVHYIFLRQPQLARMYAVHVEPQRGVVHVLRNVDLADAMHLAKTSGQILRDAINLIQIGAADLHVDWRGHSHVQNGIHHRATGKKRSNIRKLAGHRLLHAVHIFETAEPVRFV